MKSYEPYPPSFSSSSSPLHSPIPSPTSSVPSFDQDLDSNESSPLPPISEPWVLSNFETSPSRCSSAPPPMSKEELARYQMIEEINATTCFYQRLGIPKGTNDEGEIRKGYLLVRVKLVLFLFPIVGLLLLLFPHSLLFSFSSLFSFFFLFSALDSFTLIEIKIILDPPLPFKVRIVTLSDLLL